MDVFASSSNYSRIPQTSPYPPEVECENGTYPIVGGCTGAEELYPIVGECPEEIVIDWPNLL